MITVNFMPSSSQQVLLQLLALQKLTQSKEKLSKGLGHQYTFKTLPTAQFMRFLSGFMTSHLVLPAHPSLITENCAISEKGQNQTKWARADRPAEGL